MKFDRAEVFNGLDRKATLAAFGLGLATILGALGSQFIGGLVPCELCLEQRVAYYLGLPLLAVILVSWKRIRLRWWYALMAIAIAIFAWGTCMGAYHAGVEWGFWPGPTACTGLVPNELNFEDLGATEIEAVIPCDHVQFRFLGISLAGYNALISLAIVGLLGTAVADQIIRRRKARAAAL